MAVRKILIWPDPELAKIAAPVATVDDSIRSLVDDMFQTMYEANGVGLAATQLGVHQRIVVIDLDPRNDAAKDEDVKADHAKWGFPGPTAFINPEIVTAEGKVVWEEGCLSVPGINEEVTRAKKVKVRALDRQGQPFELEADGLFAIAIQHECDHLSGKVFVEYLSKLKRDVIKRKMQRLKEETDDGVVAAANL